MRLNTEENPYHATIGLRIAPGRPGSGLRFVIDAPARDMPLYLFNSAEGFSAAIERARPPQPAARAATAGG